MLSDLELLNVSEDNLEWFQANSLSIRERFAEKIIAIKDRKIVASAGSINDLLEILKSENIDESEVLIEFVVPKNEIIIL